MDSEKHSGDVTTRLVGLDFGNDRSRITVSAQLRNALAKLRTRRGLLNQELSLLIADSGETQQSAEPGQDQPQTAPVEPVPTSIKSEPSNGAIAAKATETKKVAEVTYSELQQIFMKQTGPVDLDELYEERAAIQDKMLQFQKSAGKRLPVQKEPARLRTNWDRLLQEMRWMAADFMQEDVWKRTCALSVARQARIYQERKAIVRKENEKACALHQMKLAQMASRGIIGFWRTIRRAKELEQNHVALESRLRRADLFSFSASNDLVVVNDEFNDLAAASFRQVIELPESKEFSKPETGRTKRLFQQRKNMSLVNLGKLSSKCDFILNRTELYPHQKRCVSWLKSLADVNAIVADDPGLGKRVSVVAMIAESTSQAPHLIITSASCLIRWVSEFSQRSPSSNVVVFGDSENHRSRWPQELSRSTVVLTTFQVAIVDQRIHSHLWRYVVIDGPTEHFIDFSLSRWQSLATIPADVRLLLFRSFGALDNDRPRVLRAIMDFITPGTFRNLAEFNEWSHEGKGSINHYGLFSHTFMDAFCLYRTQEEVKDQVPLAQEHMMELAFSPRQNQLYSNLIPIDAPSDFHELIRTVIRLHQICTHPDLVHPSFDKRSVLFDLRFQVSKFFIVNREPIHSASLQLIQSFIEGVRSPGEIQIADGHISLRMVSTRTLAEKPVINRDMATARRIHSTFSFPTLIRLQLRFPLGEVSSFAIHDYRSCPQLQSIREIHIPSAISTNRFSSDSDVSFDHKEKIVSHPNMSCRLADRDSSKMQMLRVLLHSLYKPNSPIVIISYSHQSLDIIQAYLRRHHFHHIREPAIPTRSSISLLASKFLLKSAPFIYLTTSRILSTFSFPSISLFASLIIFDHDWNPTFRHQMEKFLSRYGRIGNTQIYRLLYRDSFDEFVYQYSNTVPIASMNFEKLLFGSFADPEQSSSTTEAELVVASCELPVDVIPLYALKRFEHSDQSLFSGCSPPAFDQSLLPYLLRPVELWGMKEEFDIPKEAAGLYPDPVRLLSFPTEEPSADKKDDNEAEYQTPPSRIPINSRLALTDVHRRRPLQSQDNSILPFGVISACGPLSSSKSQPLLFYRKSKSISPGSQLHRFAENYKLFVDPIVKAPPSPVLPNELYIPPTAVEDDPNDPFQWGLFASSDSISKMFRNRQARKKKGRKLRRRTTRLANISINDATGSVRVRVAYSKIIGYKRKNEEPAEEPAIKKTRPAEEPPAQIPIPILKPIPMTHPVPFTDDEDALIICSVSLFGTSFIIAANFLESDLIVCGRLRTAKQCSERYAYLIRKAKDLGTRLWERLQSSDPSAPAPPMPGAEPQVAYRVALEWLRYRSQVRSKADSEKSFAVISSAARAINQHHMQCKVALRSPLSSMPIDAFKESLLRSHPSHAAALTAGHKRLMIPMANIGSTLSPRQIVELRALRDRTHESKKMSAITTPQQLASPGLRATKMTPPLVRQPSLAMSPTLLVSEPATMAVVSQQELDQVDGEVDAGSMFLLRQLVQKQPHLKARLIAILQRPDVTQPQKMELAAALFNTPDTAANVGASVEESLIPT